LKRVYFIEIDLDEDQDIKDLLKEHDEKVKVRYMRFKSLDEYDDHRYYNDVLGV
jgi:hypothetical protein